MNGGGSAISFQNNTGNGGFNESSQMIRI